MTTLNTDNLSDKTTVEPDFGIEIDYSDDMNCHLRELTSETKYNITAVYEGFTMPEAKAFIAILEANRTADIEITIPDDGTYTCKQVRSYSRSYAGGPNNVTVNVFLRGTLNA